MPGYHESTALVEGLRKYYIDGMRVNAGSYIISADKMAAIIDHLVSASADIERLRQVIADANAKDDRAAASAAPRQSPC